MPLFLVCYTWFCNSIVTNMLRPLTQDATGTIGNATFNTSDGLAVKQASGARSEEGLKVKQVLDPKVRSFGSG
jgi:hypothetical protein